MADQTIPTIKNLRGNIGIGTASPSYKLEVAGETLLDAPNGSTHSLRLGRADNANKWFFNHAGNDLRIYNAAGSGYDIMLGVNSGGSAQDNKVGIGTASPTKKLEVSSSGADVTTIKASYNSTNYLEIAHNRINAVSSGGNDSILLQTAGTTRATINQAGLVTFAGTGGGALTIGSHIHLGDNQQLRLGSDPDLTLYHDGTHSYINNATNSLYVRTASTIQLENADGSEDMATFAANGAVALFHDNVKKFETTSAGATITGDLTVSGGLTINGTTTTINSTTLQVDDKNIELGTVATPSDTTADGGGITLKGASDYTINWLNSNNSWNFNQGIVVGVDGTGYDVTFHSATASRALQWDASAKALKLDDLTTFAVGSSDDLQFYHNTHSYIESKTNHLYINNNAADGKTVFKADDGSGSAQAEFFRIDGGGGTNRFSKPVFMGTGQQIYLSTTGTYITHDGTNHYLINGTGDTTIQNDTADGDIKFKADSGNGSSTTEYFRLDGGVGNVTFSKELKLLDAVQLQLGTDVDMTFMHNDANGILHCSKGDLILKTSSDDVKILAEDDIVLRDIDDSTNFIHCVNGGPVRLYHNGSQRLETTSSGVTISGLSLELFHSGGNNYISSAASGSHLLIRNTGGANVELLVNTSEKGVIAKPNGAVELYHDNALKLTTTAGGADIAGTFGTGHINLDGELNFTTNGSKYIDVYTLANSNSFNIRHHNPSGNLYEMAFQSVANGATTLYYNGGARFATTTDGISLHGNGYVDLPDNGRLRLGTNNDMMFYHNGSSLSILDFQNHDGLIRNLTNDKLFIFQTTSGGTQYEILRLGGSGVDARFSQHVSIGSSGTPKDLTTYGSTSARYMKWDGSADLLNFMDNVKITVGNQNDIQIYHNGSHSYIDNGTTGDLFIRNNGENSVIIGHNANKGLMYVPDGRVELRFNDSKKFETTANGVKVTGDILAYTASGQYFELDHSDNSLKLSDNVKLKIGTGMDLQIYHSSSDNNNFIESYNGRNLMISANGISLKSAAGENMITATGDGAVNLFHNNTTRLQTTSTGVRIIGDKFGIYQGIEEDNYYFDDYNGARNVSAILNTQRADIIRYRPFQNLESWNGSAWVDASSQNANLENLLDGRTDTMWNVPSTYYKFRFEVSASTDWPLRALIGLQTSWSGSSFPECEMIVEEKQTDGTWATKVTAQFTSANGITNWGTMLRADTALHTGRGNTFETRITIDFYGWTPSNSSYTTIPLQNIIISSNYAGSITHDTQNILNYDRDILAPADLTVTGKSLFNGADDNSGKADFSVGVGTSPRISWHNQQVQIGGLDMNYNGNISHTGSVFGMTSWSSAIEFRCNSSSGTSARDIYFMPFNGTSTSEAMRIKGDGKVGIGTSSPSHRLHIKGTAVRIEEASGNRRLDIIPAVSGANHRYTSDNTSGGHQFENINGNLAIFTNTSNYFKHKVGIGTTSPSATLHVVPSDTYGGITVKGNVVPRIVFNSTNGGTNHWGVGVHDNNGNAFAIGHNSVGHASMDDYVVVKSGGNVGIGYTSPSHRLHVRAEADGDYVTRITNTESTAGANYGLKIDGGSNASDVALEVSSLAGTHLFEVRGDGNVGIGTTSPSNRFNVVGSSALQTAVTKITRTHASASNNTYTFEVDSSSHTSNMTSGGAMAVDVNAGRAFTINGNGKVGIGTSNPTSPLHLSTAAVSLSGYPITSMTTTIATTNIGAKLSFTGGNNANNSILGGISMGNTGEEFAGMYAMDGGSGGATHLGLFAGTSSAITEGIRILSNGAVAIKTNAVNSGITLQVNGHIYNHTGQIFAKKINADYFSVGQNAEITSGGSGKVQLKTSSNVQLEASNQGFVQLSHTASTGGGKFLTRRYSGNDYLNVFSSEYSSGALCLGYGAAGKSGAAGFVSTYDNFAGHKTILKINHDGINVLTTGTSQTDTVDADLSMTERFRVQVDKAYFATGNVGIGATSPTSKLEVSSSGAHGINISQDTGNSVLSGRLFLSTGTTNQACTLFNNGGTLRFATGAHIGNSSGSTRMTLLADGKLGIGTTSPLGTVHIFTADAGAAIATNTSHDDLIIENGGNCGIQLSGPASSYQYLAFGDTASANQGYVRYYHTDNRMDLRAGGTDTLSLVGGNVGIGTTSPNYLLDVEKAGASMRVYNLTDNGNTDIHIRTVGTTGQSRIFFGDTADHNTGAITYRHNGNSLSFKTNDAEAVRINSSGQVGIGTTSPQQELDVDGVIKQKVYTVSNLPSASSSTIGARAFVSDSYYPFSSSYLGSQISGGGSNFSPVYSDGSYWYMG